MIQTSPPGPCLPSSTAVFEAAARAVEAGRLLAEQEVRDQFMNAQVRWVGWADTAWSLDEAAIEGFDYESISAQIKADLDAAYNARMDAYIRESVIGDVGNWHPTGLFQPCSTGTEAGQQP